MDIGSILLGLALVLLVAFVVARPLIYHIGPRAQPTREADQILGRREQVLIQLRDLDFDSATGKINPEDYAAQRAQLVAEGVTILKQLDALGLSAEAAVGPSTASADDIEAAVAQVRARRAGPRRREAEIESAVIQRRSAVSAGPAAVKPGPAGASSSAASKLACPVCATLVLPDDRFCPKCGSQLTVTCGHCGRLARAGDLFCAQCGQALPAAAAADPAVRPAQS